MSKLIEINDTRKVIFDTVKQFEELVCSTMGPHGQNIALRNEAEAPVITKDGVTVAKSINSDDDFEQLIFDILKQAAEKTNSKQVMERRQQLVLQLILSKKVISLFKQT